MVHLKSFEPKRFVKGGSLLQLFKLWVFLFFKVIPSHSDPTKANQIESPLLEFKNRLWMFCLLMQHYPTDSTKTSVNISFCKQTLIWYKPQLTIFILWHCLFVKRLLHVNFRLEQYSDSCFWISKDDGEETTTFERQTKSGLGHRTELLFM